MMITLFLLTVIAILAFAAVIFRRREAEAEPVVRRDPVCPQCGSELPIHFGLGGLRGASAVCTKCDWHH